MLISDNRCEPCVESGPVVSQLAEEYAGRAAFLGINNDSVFSPTNKPHNMERLLTFLDNHQEEFQYTIVVDNAEGFAKNCKSLLFPPSSLLRSHSPYRC